jgi:cysteine-rich repeat protein
VLDATSAVIVGVRRRDGHRPHDPARHADRGALDVVPRGARAAAPPARERRLLLKGTVAGRGRQSRVVAVTSTCGDGVVDPGAASCDDGNLLDGDGCDSSCGACSGPTDFATTWDAIQTNVFDRACTTCHGASASGGLDFRAPGTYQRIVGTTAPDDPALLLVRPGERATSFLWLKIAKGTAGGHDEGSGPGMPIGPSLQTWSTRSVAGSTRERRDRARRRHRCAHRACP